MADINADLHALFQGFGRLEGKVDAILSSQKDHNTKLEKLEERVMVLETKAHQTQGLFKGLHLVWLAVAGTIGAVGSEVLQHFWKQ